MVIGMMSGCDQLSAEDGFGPGQEWVHDPSRLVEEDGAWYAYGSGTNGVALTRSRVDLETGAIYSEAGLDADALTAGWWEDVQEWNPTGEFDAPSVSPDGRLLAFTVFDEGEEGIQDATGLAIRTAGGWQPGGVILASAGEASETPRAMDASFVTTDEETFLVFGSHAGGIYVTELDPETGLMLDDGDTADTSEAPQRFVRIANDPEEGIEAATVHVHDGWHYLFVNKGSCCRGADSTYYVVMGRSRDLMGPYLDGDGVDLVDGGGRAFLDAEGRYLGPGHVGISETGDGTVMSVHFYDRDDSGTSKLLVRSLDWSDDEWPVPGDIVAEH